MSVGLLLITHNNIGASLLETATRVLDCCPLRAETLAVTDESRKDILTAEAEKMVHQLDAGDGVMILTDLFGSSPANIANAVHGRGGVRVLTGVNLPMLIRVLNYPTLRLDELAQKALSGGRDGVLLCPKGETG